MPMREIKRRYTKSEMVIMAWRSQEVAANMRERSKANQAQPPQHERHSRPQPGDVLGDEVELEQRMGPQVASKLDESLDLRKLTGSEAARYMAALGISVPVMKRRN